MLAPKRRATNCLSLLPLDLYKSGRGFPSLSSMVSLSSEMRITCFGTPERRQFVFLRRALCSFKSSISGKNTSLPTTSLGTSSTCIRIDNWIPNKVPQKQIPDHSSLNSLSCIDVGMLGFFKTMNIGIIKMAQIFHRHS